MKRMKLFSLLSIIILVVGLIVVPAMTTCQAATTPKTSEAKTLNIGMLLSVTGFFSAREIPDYNETQIAADLMNEKGGITVSGQKYLVKLILEDCKTTMDGVTAAANRLVYDKKIKFIIGTDRILCCSGKPGM